MSAPEPGCYVDGHWGQYAIARVVEIAAEFGRIAAGDDELAARHLAAMGPSTEPGLDEDEFDQLVSASDDAESWLNEHVKLPDHAWSWEDGEFGLYKLEED